MAGKWWAVAGSTGVTVALSALVALSGLAALPAQAATAVDQALLLVRGVCGLPGASLQIQPDASGKLELRITLADGQRRATALARADLDAFVAAAKTMVAAEPAELGACMDPYLDRVAAGLAAGTAARPTAGGGSYVPPTLPASTQPGPAPYPPSSPPAASPPSPPGLEPVAPAPPGMAAPPPLYPSSGDLPVGVVNNPGSPATPAAPATARDALTLQLSGCRTASRNVVCDFQVGNGSGHDLQVVVQGAHTRLSGSDGSQWPAAQASLGNQRADLRQPGNQAQLRLIAGTSPLVSLTFNNVPSGLTAIKRLEVSIGAQTSSGTQLQKITLTDVTIQGR